MVKAIRQSKTTQKILPGVLLFRAFDNGRNPQTDRIGGELIGVMTEESEVIFACLLGVCEGVPTVERMVKGSARSLYYRKAIESAQEILG